MYSVYLNASCTCFEINLKKYRKEIFTIVTESKLRFIYEFELVFLHLLLKRGANQCLFVRLYLLFLIRDDKYNIESVIKSNYTLRIKILYNFLCAMLRLFIFYR